MADNDREKQLDRLLDSMLSQYSAAQPRPGLETRVLAQIAEIRERKQAKPSRLRWLMVATGIAGAAIVVVVVMLAFRAEQQHSPTSPMADNAHTQQERHNSEASRALPTLPATNERVAVRHRATARTRRNKNSNFQTLAVSQRPAIFPTPVPLTEQERLMFSYVEHTPQSEVVAQIKSDDQKEARAFWAQGEPLLKGKAQ